MCEVDGREVSEVGTYRIFETVIPLPKLGLLILWN